MTDVGAHGAFGPVRIASLQGLKNSLVLFERGFGAAGLGAGLKAVKAKLIVEFLHQQMFQPLIARATNDLEMEILVGRALIIAVGTQHLRIGVVTLQKPFERTQFIVA